MSSTELDLPLLPSAEQIRRREFATIRRGYDPEQVRDYLQQVAAQVETLERPAPRGPPPARAAPPTVIPDRTGRGRADARGRTGHAEPDAYEQLADRLAELIRAADGQAEQIVSEAKGEATRSLDGRARRPTASAPTPSRAPRRRGSRGTRSSSRRGRRPSACSRPFRHDASISSCSCNRCSPGCSGSPRSWRRRSGRRPVRTAPHRPRPGPRAGPDPGGERSGDDDLLDPRYEDLWVSSDPSSLNVADIPALDIDFDEDNGSPS